MFSVHPNRIGALNNENKQNHNDINDYYNQHNRDNQSDVGIKNINPIHDLWIFICRFFCVIFVTY